MRRAVGMLATLMFVLGSGAGIADAAAWSIVPSPRNVFGDDLLSVSCIGASACTAVGISQAGNGAMLAERWNGKRWMVQPTPSPPGAQQTTLLSVSCTSPTACTAVGDYVPSQGGQETLAERWNGTSWTIQPTPNQSGATENVLSGVSCGSPTACIAVGGLSDSAGNELTLAERWNGTSWAIQPTPNQSGATAIGLSGVSCASPIVCTAVGFQSAAGNTLTLAERWDGTTWAMQPTPNPSGASDSELVGVSCPSTTTCTAVGNVPLSGATLAERWNGTSWAIQPTPNQTGRVQSVLSSVSCLSSTRCTAVGAAASGLTLAERWNGTRWAVQPTPNPTGATFGLLSGVSCTSPNTCAAVGSADRGSVIESYSGLPSNHFRISRIKTYLNGTITFWVKVPGRGSLDVLETAWNDNLARTTALLQPAAHRFVFARQHTTARHAATIHVRVRPNTRGTLLVHHHRYRITLRLWVTYTPSAGRSRSIGIYGLHLSLP